MRILVILMIITACSTIKKSSARSNIDPRALKYVQKFERIWRRQVPHNLKLEIVSNYLLGTARGGVCIMRKRLIQINASRWNGFSEKKKETIIFHELGHCALNRGHLYYDDKSTDWKCPPSIMNWSGISDKCYVDNYDYYINELFTGCRIFEAGGLK